MTFLNESELKSIGFKKIGKNVQISDLARIYNADQIEIGDNSRIDDFCSLSGKIVLGKHVHLASYCLLAGGRAGIEIGDFSGCAYGVKIFTKTDNYHGQSLTGPTIPEKYKLGYEESIVIESLAIVGTNSTVTPGVTLREGSSIGAHSLVTNSTEPWSLYQGAPAVWISRNSKNALKLRNEFINVTPDTFK